MKFFKKFFKPLANLFDKKKEVKINLSNDPILKSQIMDTLGYIPKKIRLMKLYSENELSYFDIFIE